MFAQLIHSHGRLCRLELEINLQRAGLVLGTVFAIKMD